jgi:small conductance mechanosensitive channel
MDVDQLYSGLQSFLGLLAGAVLVVLVVVWTDRDLRRRSSTAAAADRLRYPLLRAALWIVGVLAVIALLPIPIPMRNQFLALIGIVLSAVLGLSSTTFVGNAMAGLMLKGLHSFKTGDYIVVGEHAGRVSERGLLHVEIQTEDRDLLTLPNLFLVTNPLRVVRASGTIISAEVSLGYDISRKRIEAQLIKAVCDAGMEDPFIQIRELGDYSVTYRAAGLLKDVRGLVSARSKLRRAMLDRLHAEGIEVVSPAFVTRRAMDPATNVVPTTWGGTLPESAPSIEAIVFDKADLALSVEKMQARSEEIRSEIDRLRKEQLVEDDPDRVATLERRIVNKTQLLEQAARLIEEREQRKIDA